MVADHAFVPEPFQDAPFARQLEQQCESLLSRLRLAVIFGGDPSVAGSVIYRTGSHKSWKTYEEVAIDIADSLRDIGFRHVTLIPEDANLPQALSRHNIQMAWLNTGGIQGQDARSHAPAMLEMLGVPYVGHDPLTAATLDNKHAFKGEAMCAGLPTAPFTTWNMVRGRFDPGVNSRFLRAFGSYQGPFIVKPVSGRASLHVHFVPDLASLPNAVSEIFQATQNLVLIEKYLPGREFCIAACGPVFARGGRLFRGARPLTFAAIERTLGRDETIFTSMDIRPITRDRVRVLDLNRDPRHFSELHRLGSEVFREFNLSSLTRIDIREDSDGKLYLLEANPKPDLKRPSESVTNLISEGLPAGMSYDDLVLSLFADRLDHLLTHRRTSVEHIVELLRPQLKFSSEGELPAAHEPGADLLPQTVDHALASDDMDAFAILNETITNENVGALTAVVEAEKRKSHRSQPTLLGPATEAQSDHETRNAKK